MGLKARPKPGRLAEKLLQIRLSLGLSQDGMLERLGLDTTHLRSAVSGYELGREPPLPILLKYARSVGVSTDVLIDDALDLPGSIVKAAKSEALKRAAEPRTKRRR